MSSTTNLKEALQKSIAFTNAIAENGYTSVNGNCQAFQFEKLIHKDANGADESFTISVTNQICGFVSATLKYRKKLKESSDVLIIERGISDYVGSSHTSTQLQSLEDKCLFIGEKFCR